MIMNYRGMKATFAMAAIVSIAACSSGDKPKADSALARDSALNKDLALAGRDTSVKPALNDVPVTPAAAPAPAPVRATTPTRAATRPAPAPVRHTPAKEATTSTTASGNTVTRNSTGTAGSGGGGSVGTIASGTALSLRSNTRVCTNTFQVGQTFNATVANAVSGSNGATIPSGATVSLEVTQLKRSENARDNIVMEFAVRSVSFGGRSYPVSASVSDAQIDKVRNEPTSKDAQKVAGGAIIGAIAGRILGGSTKATVIGGAAGAAAGAGVAVGTANYEGCVPDGGNISITLNSPIQVKIS